MVPANFPVAVEYVSDLIAPALVDPSVLHVPSVMAQAPDVTEDPTPLEPGAEG